MKRIKTILIAFVTVSITITSCKSENKNKFEEQEQVEQEEETVEQNPVEKLEITQFHEVLELQNVNFDVSTNTKDGSNQLAVSTDGLPYEYGEVFNIQNQVVTSAEVADLNSDGSPELFVYTLDKSNSKGHVYAFSVNNKKSMSTVYFQPTDQNTKINQGYNGQDEFSVVENYLGQKFPVYENGIKTNKIRQILYSLEEGEASRKFVVNSQIESEI
ncbi:hypothetical protein [Flavobacterium litorale]|uniref:FG-GAP repeat-containing protein n=1 Tax=Flavobacterium litorale TaxID=2856519 RepID=A0ABX8V8I7_9FLAO|nr:hypothetical protein [Flavobacterium litorale]QYJ67150.1 hypothetical protein K1I41_06125 [Flavobacterium litorale]